MPLSEKQLAANRANGRKSRGPVTPGGLRNSSRNAIEHGMFAQTILLPGESRECFLKLLADLTTEFQATTPNEFALVETMAETMAYCRWRVLRNWISRPPKSGANRDSAATPSRTKTRPPNPSSPSTFPTRHAYMRVTIAHFIANSAKSHPNSGESYFFQDKSDPTTTKQRKVHQIKSHRNPSKAISNPPKATPEPPETHSKAIPAQSPHFGYILRTRIAVRPQAHATGGGNEHANTASS
jgi:hypothetical protein